MNFKITGQFTIIAAGLLAVMSCESDPDSAGLEYMPDMYRSAAIEPYVDYGEVREQRYDDMKMKLSAMVPPRGTVPYYGTDSAKVAINLPYHRLPNAAFRETHGLYDADLTSNDEYAAAAMDLNPMKLTEENKEAIFSNGKRIFMSKCAHCHGEKGDGNGPMTVNGVYAGVPDYANLKQLGDGQIFYSIYYGKGMMGGHGSILNKEEIWTLVHYIRKFQNADYGNADAAPVGITDTLAVPVPPAQP